MEFGSGLLFGQPCGYRLMVYGIPKQVCLQQAICFRRLYSHLL